MHFIMHIHFIISKTAELKAHSHFYYFEMCSEMYVFPNTSVKLNINTTSKNTYFLYKILHVKICNRSDRAKDIYLMLFIVIPHK